MSRRLTLTLALALLLTPEWTYGKMTLDAERLIGGLVPHAWLMRGAAT